MNKPSRKLGPPVVFPLFCDYHCRYAAFPPADAVGACRRELAVFCSLAKQFNTKNAGCLLKGPIRVNARSRQ